MQQSTEIRGLTLDEARSLLGGISAPTLHRLINSGLLDTYRVGRRRFVPLQAVHAYMEQHMENKAEAAK